MSRPASPPSTTPSRSRSALLTSSSTPPRARRTRTLSRRRTSLSVSPSRTVNQVHLGLVSAVSSRDSSRYRKGIRCIRVRAGAVEEGLAPGLGWAIALSASNFPTVPSWGAERGERGVVRVRRCASGITGIEEFMIDNAAVSLMDVCGNWVARPIVQRGEVFRVA